MIRIVEALREVRENPSEYPGTEHISRRIDEMCVEAGIQTDAEWWEFTEGIFDGLVEEARQLYDKSSFHPDLAGYDTFEEWKEKNFG